MSKICAKCEKPVYPTEELKCLDKFWHKLCFKCWECGMPLTMKNYKGYEKKPYCSAHYPQAKATVVAETPELQRLTQASKNQSQAKYHEDFEKNIRGSKIEVVDDPESQRLKQLSSVVSQVEYKGLKEKVSEMESRRQNINQPQVLAKPDKGKVTAAVNSDEHKPSPYTDRSIAHSTMYAGTGSKVEQPSHQRKVGSIADYEPNCQSNSVPHSYNNPHSVVGGSSRQMQEWEETVPMSASQNQSARFASNDSTVHTDSAAHRPNPARNSLTEVEKRNAFNSDNPVKFSKGSAEPLAAMDKDRNLTGSVNTDLRGDRATDQLYLEKQQQQQHVQQQQQLLEQQRMQQQQLHEQQQMQQQAEKQRIQQQQMEQQRLQQQQMEQQRLQQQQMEQQRMQQHQQIEQQ